MSRGPNVLLCAIVARTGFFTMAVGATGGCGSGDACVRRPWECSADKGGSTGGQAAGGLGAGGLDSSGACDAAAQPAYSSLTANPKLPDPFLMMSGTRITTQDQWTCRRAEIQAQLENWEWGPNPPKPASVSGTVSDTTISVTASNSGKSVSFTATVTLPTTGQTPFPAIIGVGGVSLNAVELNNLGVAIINFDNDTMAQQYEPSKRGTGVFYDLYGSNHPAGAMMAWAWGISRVIDVLEQNAGTSPIDARHLGVTGCSRNGKGALLAGAFDERIALTIPQESGGGGAGCWRIAQWQGVGTVETLGQDAAQTDWFTSTFSQFSSTVDKLPHDHHLLDGMVAPRGLLVIENTSQIWLGDQSCWGCSQAGRMVFAGLGVPNNMGVSQIGHSDHCVLPASQQPEVDAFVQKFLFDQSSVDTSVNKTDGAYTFDQQQWVDWSVPTLD